MSRRALPSLAVAIAALLFTGACTDRQLGTNGPRTPVQVVTASPQYQRSVEPEAFRDRLAALTAAVERLRDESSSGWIGRQDDVTGYLTELTGGGFGSGDPEASARTLLDSYGPELFGVDAAAVELAVTEAPLGTSTVVLSGDQRSGGIPVLDGRVTITAANGRVHAVRGRLFPGVSAGTEPELTAAEARRAATSAVGGTARAARLVVVPGAPSPAGDWDAVLAWEVTVVGATSPRAPAVDVFVYLDAATGDLLDVRAASPEGFAGGLDLGGLDLGGLDLGGLAQAITGTNADITGTGPLGEDYAGFGLRRSDGSVALVDTTVETFDAASGTGAIETRDGTGVSDDDLPGPVFVFPGQEITDPEAIGAHALSRFVFDYYLAEHGRRSWDGEGGTLRSTVHFGDPSFCNAFFRLDMMVYGPPCVMDGRQANATFIDPDVAAHEITHGVTATSSRLLYSGPSGALNEAFSDYFGNVIGDRRLGRDSDTVGEAGCTGIAPSPLCRPNPDGLSGIRYLPNGTSLEDYLFILDPPLILKQIGVKQDNGGVHLNSAIWNNALWTIRKRLAQMDDATMLDSDRVRQLDRAVYGALTRHLTPASSFFDARRAVEQAANELQLDPAILRVAREVFDEARICQGCVPPPPSPALAVATEAGAQKSPTVAGERIGWLDLGINDEVVGLPAQVRIGGEPAAVGRDGVTSVGFAGPDALIVSGFTAESAGVVRFDLTDGTSRVLDGATGVNSAVLGVAGSSEGGAWVNFARATLNFVSPDGTVATVPYPAAGGQPLSIGTGGGTVSVGGGAGNGVAWTPGSEPQILPIPGAGMTAAAFGDRALFVAVDGDEYAGTAVVFDLGSGQSTVLSNNASALGAALSADHAVWAESLGGLPGDIGQELQIRDTDLYLFSFATGRLYDVLPGLRGQQGFPALSGARLAWQDAVNGGDDIYSGVLPPGL